MKLRVNFGLNHWRETNWWGTLVSFPSLLTFRTVKYACGNAELDPTGRYDYILQYLEVQSWDLNYSVSCDAFESMPGSMANSCECGAIYSPFPFDHMRMCPLWKPWDQV